jgi:hypothetical protein
MFRIVFSGVFERHPTLRIVTHHMARLYRCLNPGSETLCRRWSQLACQGDEISKPYVDHFRRFYCDTAASGFAPKALELAVDFFGPHRVMFGSDTPFDVLGGEIFISETIRSIDAMAVAPETRAAPSSACFFALAASNTLLLGWMVLAVLLDRPSLYKFSSLVGQTQPCRSTHSRPVHPHEQT